MSTYREPVIGDEYDLETYGRPSSPAGAPRSRVRDHASRDLGAPAAPAASRASARASARAGRADARRPAAVMTDAALVADGPADRQHNGVRTVKIKGQATPPRRRAAAIQIDRYERRPDRTAQWALFMGVFMVVVAVVTGS